MVIRMGVVNQHFQGKGAYSPIFQLTEEVAKEAGYNAIIRDLIDLQTRSLARKHGYEAISALNFDKHMIKGRYLKEIVDPSLWETVITNGTRIPIVLTCLKHLD